LNFIKCFRNKNSKNSHQDLESLLKNWVVISYDTYFINFQDILLPLHVSCALMSKKFYSIKEKVSIFTFSSLDKDLQITSALGTIIESLEKISAHSDQLTLYNILEQLQEPIKYLSQATKYKDLITSFIAHSIEGLKGFLKFEEKGDDDPATKFLKRQRQLQKAIIEEYSEEGVERNKEIENLEIEERFQKKDTEETLHAIATNENDVRSNDKYN